MAIVLPALPAKASLVLGLTDNSALLEPPTGGDTQRIMRPGSKHYAKVDLPALSDAANDWVGALKRHKTEGVVLRLAIKQIGLEGLPTGAQVDGAGQQGSLLSIKGLGAGQVLEPETYFCFTLGSWSYLHSTTARITANGSGRATVPIAPMLRASPSNGLALNFADPFIEGETDAGPLEVSVERLRWRTTSFTITEKR